MSLAELRGSAPGAQEEAHRRAMTVGFSAVDLSWRSNFERAVAYQGSARTGVSSRTSRCTSRLFEELLQQLHHIAFGERLAETGHMPKTRRQ
jgi:hypothetical protein